MSAIRVTLVLLLLAWTSSASVSAGDRPGPPRTGDDSFSMLDVMSQLAEGDKSPEAIKCEKMSYSALCDRWIKEYMQGKPGESDLTWQKILKEMDGTDTIYLLVAKLHYRLDFDAPKTATKCNVTPYCNSLAAATEKCHGKYDTYLWDILTFQADNLENQHDYKALLALRQRILLLAHKVSGPSSQDNMQPAIDVAYIYYKMNRFAESERLCAATLAFAEGHHYDFALNKLVWVYRQVLMAENKVSAANTLMSKYGYLLKRTR